jgi:hypothetical protein
MSLRRHGARSYNFFQEVCWEQPTEDPEFCPEHATQSSYEFLYGGNQIVQAETYAAENLFRGHDGLDFLLIDIEVG